MCRQLSLKLSSTLIDGIMSLCTKYILKVDILHNNNSNAQLKPIFCWTILMYLVGTTYVLLTFNVKKRFNRC